MDLSLGLGGLLMEHHHLVLLANSCNLHRNAVIFGSKNRSAVAEPAAHF